MIKVVLYYWGLVVKMNDDVDDWHFLFAFKLRLFAKYSVTRTQVRQTELLIIPLYRARRKKERFIRSNLLLTAH